MDLIQLTDGAYQLRGGANAGLIVYDGKAVLVDTGLDKDTAKKILKAVASLPLRLAAVLITHAHADHFGGAATVRARAGVPVYAPALEAAIVANPLLEPLYLYSGACPPLELRHKFTLAEGCPVDHLLEPGDTRIGDVPLRVIAAPGHAPNQVMVAGGDVCFVGDACFAPEVARKHVVPFYVDVDRALDTLKQLAVLDGSYAAFAPGHGEAVGRVGPWVADNAARLAEIRQTVRDAVAEADEVARIVELTARRLGLEIGNPVTYWLTQTTVLACLSSCQAAGQVQVRVAGNRLVWQGV